MPAEARLRRAAGGLLRIGLGGPLLMLSTASCVALALVNDAANRIEGVR